MIPYRPDIDGLRAVAIVTVVACHAGVAGWSGGYVGVDVFFVISGYLITSLLLAEGERTGRIDAWSFYARRVRRLLPAFAAVLLATLVLGGLLLEVVGDEQQSLSRSALASLLLNANHYFWLSTGDYFDPPAELQPLLHLWSLAVEEQFYLLWPTVLAVLLRSGSPRTLRRRTSWFLGTVFVSSLALCATLTPTLPAAAFYLMPARVWELATGALVAMVPVGSGRRLAALGGGTTVAGLAAIAVAVHTFDRGTAFPGWAAALPVAGAAAAIAGGRLAPEGRASRVLASSPLVVVGKLSYSWYLWHWPLLAISKRARLGAHDPQLGLLLAGPVALALATLTYFAIENPLRRGRWASNLGARRTVATGGLLTLVCAALAGALLAWSSLRPRTARESAAIRARLDVPPLRAACHGILGDEPRIPPEADCLVPQGAPRIDAVLLGDSMADHWMPALTEVAAQSGFSILQMTRDACPPLFEYANPYPDPSEVPRCDTFRAMVRGEVARLRAERGLRVAVLSAAWIDHRGSALDASLQATLDELDALGLRVVIIGPTPRLPFRAPECLLRHDNERCALSLARFEQQAGPVAAQLRSALERRAGARFVDPVPFLCGEDRCDAHRDGLTIYLDTAHLTASAARAYALSGRLAPEWFAPDISTP